MRISKVTTRTGDDGTTGLSGGQRVAKDCLRVETCGTVDELSSFLGLAAASGSEEGVARELREIQNELFHLGADLSAAPGGKGGSRAPRIAERHVARLERGIERFGKEQPPLKEFILPGGTPAGAALHVARAVCRRAERLCVRLAREEGLDACAVKYLNRLSDLLFILARHENRARGETEVQWDQGR